MPGLLAVIFLGMFFGPFGVAWLGRLGLVTDLGTIGILYLMFLAGLDVNALMENRTVPSVSACSRSSFPSA